ncbi:MAG: hypothetical protein HQL57_03585 [Magnetococcales bacterium]|nr:hypothetical protein [Magnetococcales bacterium]MBF0156251.1 hypothetical protein [Magnetococcales bacterium]
MPNSRFRRSLSFLRGIVLFYLIFLVFFFAATPLLAFLLYWQTDLSQSMLPQLIGFCIQGMFLILVFAFYERRTTLHARQSHKFALCAFLSTLVEAGLPSTGADAAHLRTPRLLPGRLAEAIRLFHAGTTTGLPSDACCLRIREKSRYALSSLESLIPVAAQVDPFHLNQWMEIVIAGQALNTITAKEGEAKAVAELLDGIRRFDELELV